MPSTAGAVAHATDRTLMHALADRLPSWADRLLEVTTKAADRSLMWWATAGVLAATGPSGRLAARDGLTALAATVPVVEAVKVLAGRDRPTGRLVGRGPKGRPPRTSSFPSSHSAKAAAFAVAAGARRPAALPVLVPAAVVVAASRVAAVRHFPADAVAGLGLGTAVGAAVALAQRERARAHRPRATPREADAPGSAP